MTVSLAKTAPAPAVASDVVPFTTTNFPVGTVLPISAFGTDEDGDEAIQYHDGLAARSVNQNPIAILLGHKRALPDGVEAAIAAAGIDDSNVFFEIAEAPDAERDDEGSITPDGLGEVKAFWVAAFGFGGANILDPEKGISLRNASFVRVI